MLSAHQARRGLLVFMLALVATTALLIWVSNVIPRGGMSKIGFSLLMITFLSYSPAVASLIARLSLREGIKDISLQFRGEWVAPAMLIAWLWPVACGLLTYGLAWLAGFTRFQWTSIGSEYGSWGPESLLGISIYDRTALAAFSIRLVACVLFSFAACAQSFGEELGWRGYFLTRLFDAKIPVPILWNGLIWGFWPIHYVVYVLSSSTLPERGSIALFFFLNGITAHAYLFSYLRLRSGSIWPAVLAHASSNSVLGLAFDPFTVANTFWKGELYLLSAGLPVLVLLTLPRPWTVRYWPQNNVPAPMSVSAEPSTTM